MRSSYFRWRAGGIVQQHIMYVSIYYGHGILLQSMHQPGKIANPTHGQLNKENEYFPVPVPRQPVHSPYSGWIIIWCLRRPFIYLNRHTPSGLSRVYRVTQLRADGVHCPESTGTGTTVVVLNIVPETDAAFGITMDQSMCASFFPHPLLLV